MGNRDKTVVVMNGGRVELVIVGSGNVAEAFACAVARCGSLTLKQIFARNAERAAHISSKVGVEWTSDVEQLSRADLYIIAVSDSAVGDVASALPFAPGSTVVHTAGSVPLAVLPSKGVHRGILYAFQSFTAGRDISFEGLPLFVEAESEEVYALLEGVGQMLGCRVARADSDRRRVVHLAGVLANNFVNHLYALAGDVIGGAGLDFDTLKPLIRETALKALASDDPRDVQTGPARRGDRAVVERHLEMLREDECKQKIYKYITESIWETSKKI